MHDFMLLVQGMVTHRFSKEMLLFLLLYNVLGENEESFSPGGIDLTPLYP